MKKLILSIGLGIILAFGIGIIRNAGEVRSLTDKLIRLHVIADSDDPQAQELKLKVRDGVLSYVSENCQGLSGKREAEDYLKAHIGDISELAGGIILDSGFRQEVSVSYEKAYVDRREYEGFSLPEGIYDSLCIRIGRAEGRNWWCVLYPSLCLSCSASIEDCRELSDEEIIIIKEPKKVRYKLFCFELIERLRLKLFKGKVLKK